jgi:Na+-transporting methylmalonyl-CoA/oxaloacetate decarboxylase gamma subunit
MGLVLAALAVGLVLLILGIAVKALKFLIILAVVVWVAGLVRGYLAKRSRV